jgi:hypothetical protein
MTDEEREAEFWRRKLYDPKSPAEYAVWSLSFIVPGTRRMLHDSYKEAKEKAKKNS